MKFWLKNIFILLLGLGSCGGSYFLGEASVHKIISWEKAPAKIAPSNSSTRKAVVSFKHDGKIYTVRSFSDTKSTTGTAVFPKENPDQAELLDYKKFLMVPLFLAVLGFILVIIGFFSMQNRVAGKKVPAPSYDANPHYQGLKDYVERKNKQSKGE